MLVMLLEAVLPDSMTPLNGLLWMDATPLISQRYKRRCREGPSSKTIDTDMISIHPSTLLTVNSYSGTFTAWKETTTAELRWLVPGLQEALLDQRLKETVGKTN